MTIAPFQLSLINQKWCLPNYTSKGYGEGMDSIDHRKFVNFFKSKTIGKSIENRKYNVSTNSK